MNVTAPNNNLLEKPGNEADKGSGNKSVSTYVNLGVEADTVVLGDENGSYYTIDGWHDSLYVDGFNTQTDRLVLFGNSDLYQVTSDEQGSWLLFGDDGSTAIAYLNGVTCFDLTSDAVTYTNASTSAPTNASTSAPDTGNDNTQDGEQCDDVFSQLGIPQYEDIVGSLADDKLLGSSTAEQLIGFGGNDYAEGGRGADLFILGDFGGSYYAKQGWNDSIYIEDFTVGVDQLQLQGTASQYSTTTDEAGMWLYDQGDAIAYLKGINVVNLESFQYAAI